MSHTGETFTGGVAIDLLGGTAGATALMNGELLADATGTTASTVDQAVTLALRPVRSR